MLGSYLQGIGIDFNKRWRELFAIFRANVPCSFAARQKRESLKCAKVYFDRLHTQACQLLVLPVGGKTGWANCITEVVVRDMAKLDQFLGHAINFML